MPTRPQLPAPVEAAAYFAVAEALDDAARRASADQRSAPPATTGGRLSQSRMTTFVAAVAADHLLMCGDRGKDVEESCVVD